MAIDIDEALKQMGHQKVSPPFDETYEAAMGRATRLAERARRRSRMALGSFAAAIVICSAWVGLARQDGNRVAPVASPTETTAVASAPDLEIDLAFQQDLVASGLLERAAAHFGDRYGGSQIEGSSVAIFVSEPTTSDDEWLMSASTGLSAEIRPARFTQAEADASVDLIRQALSASGDSAFGVGYRLEPPAIVVGVPVPSEALRSQLQGLTAIPIELVEGVPEFIGGASTGS